MAESKSVDLFLRVSTVLMGGDVLGKLSSGFGGLAKQVGIVNQAMGKIIGTAAAITIGYKGISAASDWLKEGVKGAKQFRDANEILRINLERFPHVMKLGEEGIRDYQKRIGETTERLQETGLLMKGDLLKGFQELIAKGMNPDRVFQLGDAFQGLAIRLGKTGEETADLLNRFIVGKRPPIELREAMAEVAIELDKYAKLSKKGKGVGLIEDMTKNARLAEYTAKYLETIPGKEAKIAQQAKIVAEQFGDPILKLQESWINTVGVMQKALKPLVDLLTKEFSLALERIAKWLEDPKTVAGIEKFGKATVQAFEWIKDNWTHISTGLTAIGIAMGGLAIVGIITNPLLLAVAAVGLLGAAIAGLSKHWDLVKPAIDSALGPLKNIWVEVEPGMREAGTKIVQFFKGEITWEECWTGISESFAKIKWDVVFQQALTQIQENMSKFGTWMGDELSKIDWGTTLGTVFGTAFRLALEGVKIAQAIGEGLVKAISGGITNTDWGALAKSIGDFAIKFAQAFGKAFAGFDWGGMIAATPIGKFYSWFTGITGKAMEAGGAVMSKIGAGIAQTPPALIERPAPPELGPMAGEAWTNEVQNFITGVKASQPEVRTVETESGKVSSQIGNWSSMVYGAASSLGEMVSKLGEVETKAAGVGYALSRLQAPTIPTAVEAFQHGGITRGPSIAGEAGPEMILPLNEPGRWRQIIEGLSSFGMRGARAGGGEVSVQVSPNITINGVGRGEAEAVGREVQRAMQDPINRLLESLARARDEERRLAYV